MLQKHFISDKCWSLDPSIHQRILMYSTVLNIGNNKNNFNNNVYLTANEHIRMISEGSCDTEDWSNVAEIQLFDHRNILHFKGVI